MLHYYLYLENQKELLIVYLKRDSSIKVFGKSSTNVSNLRQNCHYFAKDHQCLFQIYRMAIFPFYEWARTLVSCFHSSTRRHVIVITGPDDLHYHHYHFQLRLKTLKLYWIETTLLLPKFRLGSSF